MEREREETIVFGRKGKNAEKVKWLGVILDSNLRFEEHIASRVKRARQILGNLNKLGSSTWGMTSRSWRQAYTIVRTIALWGAEVGWRGLEKWRTALKTLQYQSLRKCAGAPHGTAQEAVDKVTGVESIEGKMDAMQARYVARSMGNPTVMEGLWPADFKNSQEDMGEGRHWTDHEDEG